MSPRNKGRRPNKILEKFQEIKVLGSKSIVFIDESGFEEFRDCTLVWSKKEKKSEVQSQAEDSKEGLNCPNGFYGKPEYRTFLRVVIFIFITLSD